MMQMSGRSSKAYRPANNCRNLAVRNEKGKNNMKKIIAILLTAAMLLSLTACGSGDKPSNSESNTTPSSTGETTDNATGKDSAPQETPAENKPAESGILTINLVNAAIVVNGKAVPMPYRLGELEAAGVPEDESRNEIKLAPGDFFSVNLYLDENEDYVISPAYYNGGDDTINIADARAEEITMITYSGEPVDQGVSLLGVTFGMKKSDVRAMLGEPMYDNGDYFEWEVTVSDAGYKGSFYIYFADDSDTAGASQIDLTLIEE